MKRISLIGFVLAVAFLVAPVQAQQVTKICVPNTTNSGCTPVDSNNPFPVTGGGGGGGGTSSNFGGAFPTAGTAAGFKDSTGSNMAAGNLDSSGNLKVNVAAGGAGGGAVYGPTAVGSPAANPPVLEGGTTDGTATGNVSVQKVVSGVASSNTAQVNGVTTLTGAGATGTGSQRVTAAQDTTTVAGAAPLTTGIYVTGPSAAALATSANQTTGNTSAATTATNTGTTATGIGTPADSAYAGSGSASVIAAVKGVYAAATAAIPAGTNNIGSVNAGNAGGCGGVIPISQTASTDLHTASGKSYICSIILVVPDAEVVSLVEGTGTTCGTGTAALMGATTAANGLSLSANGGWSAVSGFPWLPMQTSNDHLCLLQSGTGRIAGVITYNDH